MKLDIFCCMGKKMFSLKMLIMRGKRQKKNVRRIRLLLKFYYPSQKKMKLSKMVIFRFKQFAIMQKSLTLIRELS